MNAIGLCQHNNLGNHCPSCLRESKMNRRMMQGLGRLGSYSDFAGGMGACPEGYYDLKIFGVSTGQCAPSLSTVTSGAQSGALSTVATGVAKSPATSAAIQSATAQTLGNKIVGFYKNQPVMAWGLTAGVIALVVYGGMSFVRGR